MRKIALIASSLAILLLATSCFTVIRPGEVGLKQSFGRLKNKTLYPGGHYYNMFFTKIIKVPVRTSNLPIDLESLPTKEGLNVSAEFAILYSLKPEYAKKIVETIGLQYENAILISVLKSAAPNVTSKYYAKDLYTEGRSKIGQEIANEMTTIIGDRGIVVEAVLLKAIRLPNGLAKSIEEKLEAEQESQRMEFILTKEKKEAERKIIEAEGIKKSQIIISEGLTPEIIQYKSIDAFMKLSGSPGTRVIITDGKAPFLIGGAGQ